MLKAIDTSYKGYLFRSRLEARWAVFFDAAKVVWEYEKEGYDLDGTWYLPDFWLPIQDCFVEIKPTVDISSEDWASACLKCNLLGMFSKKRVWLFEGDPYPGSFQIYSFPHIVDGSFGDPESECRQYNEIAACRRCDGLELVDMECGDCMAWGHQFGPHTCSDHDRIPCTGDSNHLLPAYQAARSARFEHR